LIAYDQLVEKGPFLCGSLVAKKLSNGKGFWELIGHEDNEQPRILFYLPKTERLIVFVYAFTKKGKKDYKHAIEVADSRRRLIERSGEQVNAIEAFTAHNSH
jgi:phage-related protein